MKSLSHLNEKNDVKMVDVGEKASTVRKATARTIVVLPDDLVHYISDGEIKTKKGPVFQTAVIAGIMAAKKTGELIPLCHPLALEDCKINIDIKNKTEVYIECTVSITAKTGVEMEALTGCSIAALTIYDMCKSFSHDIIIKETRLMEKSGGKHDFKRT